MAWLDPTSKKLETFTEDIRFEWFYADDGHRPPREKALEVNRFTYERLASGPAAWVVDDALHQWLLDHGANPERRNLIPVGFNVGSFDMPFVRKYLPKSAALISRRAVDLNSLCFAFGGGQKWQTYKRELTAVAQGRLELAGVEPNFHDAGYDAALAITAFEYARSILKVER